MFLAIGFLLAIAWAFAGPYVFAGSDDPARLTSLTTVAAIVVGVGGGAAIDRRRRVVARRAAAAAEVAELPDPA